MLKRVKRGMVFLALCSVSVYSASLFAQTQCSSSGTDKNQDIYFYTQLLGTYDVNLNIALTAIKNHQTNSKYPYTQKEWTGACPGGLTGADNSCIEFTVYPNDENFSPSGIMKQIKKYNNDKTDRGEVRVLTDKSLKHYVYTTDHEQTFCGPYVL
jgi:hypothetical protein